MTEATICATSGCFHGNLSYFERGDVGSWYCSGCLERVMRTALRESEERRGEGRLRESYQEGERVERAEIVAWLRMRAKVMSKKGYPLAKGALEDVADEIERGEHK